MINSLLKMIKEDLESKVDFNTIKDMDDFQVHFGVCLYNRNKYLWGNEFTSSLLMSYFNVDNVDDLSHKILEDILKSK